MLKKNLIANYVGNAWSALMSLLFVPGYIQYIGIEAYGLIGLFAMLQAWLGLLDMGMTLPWGAKWLDLREEDIPRSLYATYCAAWSGSPSE